MPTLIGMLPSSNVVLIPGPITTAATTTTTTTTAELSYKVVIRQLAAQTQMKPYGDIPPMLNKKRNDNKKSRRQKLNNNQRRMSHVEDWIKVDSKESLPDEEDLVQASPFKNLLSQDFFTQVLPLHMPPPSLSKKDFFSEDDSVVDYGMEDDDDDDDDDDDEIEDIDDIEDDDDDDDEEFDDTKSEKENGYHHRLRKSFTKSASFISTSATHTISSSPPQLSNFDHHLWQETIAKLKQTLKSTKQQKPENEKQQDEKKKEKNLKKRTKKMLIPMPIPPRKPIKKQKRRSEATTQPRFNPDTNTYTRDTRSNPDHLRIISAELNMMRKRKLLSPLKPRGFLPRRKDSFVRGENRKRSQLITEYTL
ncbi:hypothetical protein K501DRAFT_252275 [Backusella circina FSU 941]|nr:hypothetical protein K501DRAFT_252275 [Backusella circina FSU 941]